MIIIIIINFIAIEITIAGTCNTACNLLAGSFLIPGDKSPYYREDPSKTFSSSTWKNESF